MIGSLGFETSIADGVYTHRHVADGPRRDEAVPVYVAFIWRLTEGRTRYGLLRYWLEYATAALGEPSALVAWEHEVENEESDDLGSVRGYVAARSLGPPEAGDHARQEAGLYALPDVATLMRLVDPAPSDASIEINLYALDPANVARVLTSLRGGEAPQLDDLLGPNDMLVDLAVAIDLGYRDVLVVRSRSDLSDELESLAREYAR